MKKIVSAILFTTLLLSGCGGKSSSEGNSFIGSSKAIEDTLIISDSNQSLSISPRSKQKVLITGSNNDITISTEPSSALIEGNDNTVRIKNKAKVTDSGLGNIILGLEGSALFKK